MKFVKIAAIAALVAASVGLSACSSSMSKPAPASTVYSK